MALIHAPTEPRAHADLVRSILADPKCPKTDDDLFAANDNRSPTGAKANSWPAMRLNAGDGHELSGSLWNVGDGVTLLSPMLFPTQNSAVTLYAQSVVYEQDGNGTTTTLNLVVKAGLHGAVFNDVPDVSGANLPPPPRRRRLMSRIGRWGGVRL